MPAVMQLLGKRNWWIPDWLERILPRLDVERVAVGTARDAQRTVRAAGIPYRPRLADWPVNRFDTRYRRRRPSCGRRPIDSERRAFSRWRTGKFGVREGRDRRGGPHADRTRPPGGKGYDKGRLTTRTSLKYHLRKADRTRPGIDAEVEDGTGRQSSSASRGPFNNIARNAWLEIHSFRSRPRDGTGSTASGWPRPAGRLTGAALIASAPTHVGRSAPAVEHMGHISFCRQHRGVMQGARRGVPSVRATEYYALRSRRDLCGRDDRRPVGDPRSKELDARSACAAVTSSPPRRQRKGASSARSFPTPVNGDTYVTDHRIRPHTKPRESSPS